MTKYDIVIVKAMQTADASIPFAEEVKFGETKWLQLDADLETARSILRRIFDAGGGGYIVSAAYRSPRVSVDEAYQLALEVHDQLVRNGKRLAPLEPGFDDIMWWTFLADDLDDKEQGRVPGNLRIAVDKLDGRIRTEEEYREWLQLFKK